MLCVYVHKLAVILFRTEIFMDLYADIFHCTDWIMLFLLLAFFFFHHYAIEQLHLTISISHMCLLSLEDLASIA